MPPDAVKTYQVIRSLDVDAIMREIVQQRETRSGARGAEKLLDSFERTFQSLESFPLLGRSADDEILHAKGYRKIAVAEFIVLYRVELLTKRVIIVHVYHQRENLEGLV